MSAVRRLLEQRQLAALFCAAALLVRLLVPAGFMLDGGHGRVAITICSGSEYRVVTMDVHGGSKDHGKAEMPCAFSGLSATALGAIDPIQLAALIAFVMAVGFACVGLPPPLRPAHLRPPLRGPPSRA